MLKQMLLAVVVIVSAIGCGPANKDSVSVPTGPIVENVRSTLQGYAETGKKGSSITAIDADINGIASTDSATAAQLRAKYPELQAAQTPEDVKAVAKEMLAILGG